MQSQLYNATKPDNFLDTYFAWLRLSLALTLSLPMIAILGTLSFAESLLHTPLLIFGAFCVSLVLMGWYWRLLKRPLKFLQQITEHQSTILQKNIFKKTNWRIIVITACSLLLELAFIRWLASLYEIFAFYKNCVLLACFAGLGIGYSCSKKRLIYSIFLPLLAVALSSLIFLRYGMPEFLQYGFHFLPESKQLSVHFTNLTSALHFLSFYTFLTAVFCMTVLLFLPLGQLSGRLMDELPNLQAYSKNLIGSLLGVLSMILLSQMWTPPTVWFALAMIMALPFLFSLRRALFISSIGCLIGLAALSMATSFGFEYIYSPYQLLQRGRADLGLTIQIAAAGQYYQRILDLSSEAQADPRFKRFAFYFDLPYRFKPAPDSVLIVGSGTGNDVAAALRAGAKHVDAVEIDPAIHQLGLLYHPEQPYQDPRVTTTITDARQFLRTTKNKYDLIVFALLDSHTATSQGSQLRTDSYIYTVESFKEVRDHLKDNGILSLSFSLSFCKITPGLAQKLKLMLAQVFPSAPYCITPGYDTTFTLIQAKNGPTNVTSSLESIVKSGYCPTDSNNTAEVIKSDPSTDDWPFFYMTHKHVPLSYLLMLLLVVSLTITMLFTMQEKKVNLSLGNLVFMLLGAGFMLIETKAITELGLYFGNTWQVTGIVIVSILIMAFLANLLIEHLKPNRIFVPAICLLFSLGLGLFLHHINIGPLFAVIALTLPVLFSGIIFSILLGKCRDISAAMSMNILGALAGGALEYLALWTGYQTLYVVAIIIYLMALLCCIKLKQSPPSLIK